MIHCAMAILVSMLATLAFVENLSAQTPSAANPLEPLAWLVGGTWVNERTKPDGSSLTIESKYEWTARQKAIKFSTVHNDNGQPSLQVDGTYFWHPGRKQILMLQTGWSVTESVVELKDGMFLHDNTLSRANGTTDRQRAEFTRDGEDTYLLKASVLNGDVWKEVVTFTYKRRGTAEASAPAKRDPATASDPARPATARVAPAKESPPAAATDAPARKLEDLAWLTGSWIEHKPGVDTEEHWIAPKGDLMTGMNRTTRGTGRTSFEFLRIARTPSGISYFAQPSGRPPTEFKLVQAEDKKVVFENREHDFPQRIIYWLDKDAALHARIEGTIGGQSRSQEWTWQAAKK